MDKTSDVEKIGLQYVVEDDNAVQGIVDLVELFFLLLFCWCVVCAECAQTKEKTRSKNLHRFALFSLSFLFRHQRMFYPNYLSSRREPSSLEVMCVRCEHKTHRKFENDTGLRVFSPDCFLQGKSFEIRNCPPHRNKHKTKHSSTTMI